MAKTVSEIMNRELFSVRGEDSAAEALGFILALNITGAAVLGADGKPVGHVSMRDLVRAEKSTIVSDAMKAPATTVRAEAKIEEAAMILAESGLHRLVAIDSDGRAVGMLSALDVIRGLVGVPVRHPAAFPHYDRDLGVCWSDDELLDAEHAEQALDGAGVLALVHGKAGIPERIVWVENTPNVRMRLVSMLNLPVEEPLLARALKLGELRFRYAFVHAEADRKRVAEALQGMAMASLRPAQNALA